MNKDKKLQQLFVPLIFLFLTFVPVIIFDILPNVYIQKMPEVIWIIFYLILSISMWIWGILFHFIPIGVYIAILVAYTVVSWKWILKQKKGNTMYGIVWLVLCVLSTIMYWRGDAILYERCRQ